MSCEGTYGRQKKKKKVGQIWNFWKTEQIYFQNYRVRTPWSGFEPKYVHFIVYDDFDISSIYQREAKSWKVIE